MCAVALLILALPHVALAQGYQPSAEERAEVFDLAERYLAAVDAGDPSSARSLWSDRLKALMSPQQTELMIGLGRTNFGQLRDRTLVATTWYDNPPSAPPGLYAALDYEASYERAARHCSYLIISRVRPGQPFHVDRSEENVLLDADAENLRRGGGEAAVVALWNSINLNCPDQ